MTKSAEIIWFEPLKKVNVFLRKSTFNKKVPLRQSSGWKNITTKCLKGNFSNSLYPDTAIRNIWQYEANKLKSQQNGALIQIWKVRHIL